MAGGMARQPFPGSAQMGAAVPAGRQWSRDFPSGASGRYNLGHAQRTERKRLLLSRDLLDDESLAGPLHLLTQYREMCKALGTAQATGAPVPRATLQQLARIEAELKTRLWLAAQNGDQPSAVSKQQSVISYQSSAISGPGASPTQNSELITQNSSLSPQSPSPTTHHPTTRGMAMVYSDGACIGNPGPGGYGAIVRVAGRPEKVVSDGKERTTNNEMEMTGAVEGLRAAISLGAMEITIVSDSEYLVKGMNSWMKGWLRNGWKTRTGDPVKNRELWEELHRLSQGRAVTWSWVRGHASHPENERCDALAVAAAQQAASHARR